MSLTQNYPYPPPPRSLEHRNPLPEAQAMSLPPMSSLLPRHERLEQQSPSHNIPYPPRSFPPPPAPPSLQQPTRPLWLGPDHAAPPPQPLYQHPPPPPPRRTSSHSSGAGYLQDLPLVASPTASHQNYAQHNSTSPISQHHQQQDLRRSVSPQPVVIAPVFSPNRASYNSYFPPPPPSIHTTGNHQLHNRPPSSSPTSHTPTSNAMQISGLLSNGPSTHPSRPPPKHIIRMRQQPLAARACGFGERDRRVIDPPPILQMTVEDPNASAEEMKALIRQPCAVVHCTLWDPVANKDDTAMPGTTDKRQQRRLMGTLVSSPFVGKDEHGVEGCFFTFPDLSVRTPGKYSLRFSLMIIDPNQMRLGHSVPVSSVVFSDTFHVYNAKDFGGMRPSTALTKQLKGQGCLISVKKGNAKTGGNARDEDDDDDEEDDDGDDEKKPKRAAKRVKR
ncbi:hypothetical protein HYFRA_00011899 [Hymenoscyphus fraxineus]|uniref:Velvet domain-containing protein n=1 Tax=Hymenoscyphus fraxineus TaxID=746836 RepID=A0A9N9KYE2_9HELO|nr:hypothetical protein HYFRA_00011899 [Hymenoscyphus fraxineus]